MECVTCTAILQLTNGMELVYQSLWPILTTVVFVILGSFLTIQILSDVIRLINGTGDIYAFQAKYLNTGFWTIIAVAALSQPSILWDGIFDIFLNIGPYVGIELLKIFSPGQEFPASFDGLMMVIERAFFDSVYDLTARVLNGVSIWDNFLFFFSAGLLILPYIVFLYQVVAAIVKSLIQIYVTAFFAPIWIGSLVFDSTRSLFPHVLRILATAALQLVCVACTVAIILSAMGTVFVDISDPSKEVPTMGDLGTQWLSFVLLGIFMVFLINTAVGIPSLIMNTFLHNGASTPAVMQSVAVSAGRAMIGTVNPAAAGAAKAVTR